MWVECYVVVLAAEAAVTKRWLDLWIKSDFTAMIFNFNKSNIHWILDQGGREPKEILEVYIYCKFGQRVTWWSTSMQRYHVH